MAFDFASKAIVVTGGASGLGRAFCAELIARGASVGVADIELDRAERVAQELGGRAHPFMVDVASTASVEALAASAWATFGRVDGIFNNAGVGGGRDLVRTSEADYDWVMGVNLKGVWNGCRIFGQRFVEQKTDALIVNTGSEHSLGVPHLNLGVYTAAKHAVHGMTDVLRHELPGHIQVSLFCPGMVATDIWNSARNRPEAFGAARHAPEVSKQINDRGMDPVDVARSALDAIAGGAFYVVTHSHNLEMARARQAELEASFAAQTAGTDSAAYEVNAVIADVLGSRNLKKS